MPERGSEGKFWATCYVGLTKRKKSRLRTRVYSSFLTLDQDAAG